MLRIAYSWETHSKQLTELFCVVQMTALQQRAEQAEHQA